MKITNFFKLISEVLIVFMRPKMNIIKGKLWDFGLFAVHQILLTITVHAENHQLLQGNFWSDNRLRET